MVVFPVPGGPHRIIEGTFPCSIAVLRMLPLPVRCSCPASASSVVGRSRSANGVDSIIKANKLCAPKVAVFSPFTSQNVLHRPFPLCHAFFSNCSYHLLIVFW